MHLLTVILISVSLPACFNFFSTARGLSPHTQAPWCPRAPSSSWKCDVSNQVPPSGRVPQRRDHLTTSSLHNPAYSSDFNLNCNLCHWSMRLQFSCVHSSIILSRLLIALPITVKVVLSRVLKLKSAELELMHESSEPSPIWTWTWLLNLSAGWCRLFSGQCLEITLWTLWLWSHSACCPPTTVYPHPSTCPIS